MSTATGPFVVEGYLNLVSQEGGSAGPDWEMDGNALAKRLADHFGVKFVHRFTPGWREMPHSVVPGDLPIGRVKITIERIK